MMEARPTKDFVGRMNALIPEKDGEGIISDALIDFAADAEKTGLQLDACQAFTKATRGSTKK